MKAIIAVVAAALALALGYYYGWNAGQESLMRTVQCNESFKELPQPLHNADKAQLQAWLDRCGS
jgi:uncharacterized protein HemX